MTEYWKTIEQFGPDYQVSDLGRIRRMTRAKSGPLGAYPRIMKSSLDSSGYPQISVSIDRRRITRKVHILVALAFIGPKPSGHEVNHKNRTRNDARAVNLEWVTRLENVLHGYSFEERRLAQPRGIVHHNAKLTDARVREIRRLLKAGHGQVAVSKSFGVSQCTISNIALGKIWKHVKSR